MTETTEENVKSERNIAFLLATLSDVGQKSQVKTETTIQNTSKIDSVPLLKPPKKRTGDDEVRQMKLKENYPAIEQTTVSGPSNDFGTDRNLKVKEDNESQKDDEEFEDDDTFDDQDFQPDLSSPRSSIYAYERPLRTKNEEMELDEPKQLGQKEEAPISESNLNSNGQSSINEEVGEKRKRLGDDDWKPALGKKKIKSPQIKKPKIVKKPPDGRLSFQEAAVRVLVDQRAKGVHALSTRKIWELIMQSGLVDTKCKTPVSSLSSRITEDVRTKGNKSVFVRVGEGLYALRKGMKKQELEKFLATKYPHLAREIPDDAEDDMSAQEEEMEEKSPEVDITSSTDSSNEVEIKTLAPSPEIKEQPMKDISKEPMWIGLPLKTKANGDILYSQVKIESYRYRIGDCAYITPNSEDQSPYVGQITKLWQSASPALRDKPPHERMFVQCLWYYHPEDIQGGRSKKHHKREIFLSDLSDVNTVDNLISPVEVLSYSEFNKRLSNGIPKKDMSKVYFCRYFYNDNTKELHPLNTDETGHVEIPGLQEERSIPQNWPSNVQYTANTLWRVPEQFREYFQMKYHPNVEVKKIELEGKPPRLVLVTTSNIKEGTILGEYTGVISVSSLSEEDSTAKSNYLLHTLYKDEEVRVRMDAILSGNEFRFISQVGDGSKPNVKFAPMWLAGKWHMVVVSLSNIDKGMELKADFSQIQWNKEIAEEISVGSPSSSNSSNQSSPLHSDKNSSDARSAYSASKLVPSSSNENTILLFGQQSQPQAPPTLPTPQQ